MFIGYAERREAFKLPYAGTNTVVVSKDDVSKKNAKWFPVLKYWVALSVLTS